MAFDGQRRLRRAAVSRGVFAATIVASGCGFLTGRQAGGSELGRFEVTSPVLGNMNVAPVECLSGQREMYFGADFVDPATHTVVRLVVDPIQGPAVRLFDPGQAQVRNVVLGRTNCATLGFAVENTNTLINGIRLLRVSLELDCRLPDGTAIRGAASATCG